PAPERATGSSCALTAGKAYRSSTTRIKPWRQETGSKKNSALSRLGVVPSYAPEPAAAQGRELLLDARSCALCFSFVDHRFHQAFAFKADPKPRSRSASLGQTLPGHHLFDFRFPDQEDSVAAVNDAVDHRLLPHATTPLMIYAAGSTQAKPCFLMSPSLPWPMPVIRRRSSRLVKGLFWMISSA